VQTQCLHFSSFLHSVPSPHSLNPGQQRYPRPTPLNDTVHPHVGLCWCRTRIDCMRRISCAQPTALDTRSNSTGDSTPRSPSRHLNARASVWAERPRNHSSEKAWMMERRALFGTSLVSGRGRPVVGDRAPLDSNHCKIACKSSNGRSSSGPDAWGMALVMRAHTPALEPCMQSQVVSAANDAGTC